MVEEPYAAAVDTEYLSLTCSKCFAVPNIFLDRERLELSSCNRCEQLRYCSETCQKADLEDHEAECKFFRSSGFVPSSDARMVMRMIARSKRQPEHMSFSRKYSSLMDHSVEHGKNVNFMAKASKIHEEICRFMETDAPNYNEFALALSKKAINSFPIHDGSPGYLRRGIGIYLGLSQFNHSCRPNFSIINQGSKMILKFTNVDNETVTDDELPLTINYFQGSGNILLETSARRDQLHNSYFFTCQCEVCEDIESDKKKTSGRSTCCPGSWFSIVDGVCNSCQQIVSLDQLNNAVAAMELLKRAALIVTERKPERDLIPELIERFDLCREVLSDENTYPFFAAFLIYSNQPPRDIDPKYRDLCIDQARKLPRCLLQASLLINRFFYYEEIQKPLPARMKALKEALDSVQVVFGSEHDLSKTLLQKVKDESENLNVVRQ